MRFWIDEHAFAAGETELLRQALRVNFLHGLHCVDAKALADRCSQ